MNTKQKTALKVTAFVIILMMIFPPFHEPAGQGLYYNKGFAFLFSPPMSEWSNMTASVNYMQLMVQWIGVGTVCAIAFLLGKDSRGSNSQTTESAPNALATAFARSKMAMWVALAFVVVSLIWAQDSHDFALKLIGNGIAASVVWSVIFAWNFRHALKANKRRDANQG